MLLLLILTLSRVHASPVHLLQQRSLPPSTCSQNITNLKWPNDLPAWHSGTPSGTPFCVSRYDHGAKIVGLAAFKEYDPSTGCEGRGGINRLEIRFDDGHNMAIGGTTKDCDAGKFALSDNELFKEVFSNVAGSNTHAQGKLGWSHYSVNSRDNVDWSYLKDEYNPGAVQQDYSTGGGLLIGLVGYQHGDVLETVVPIFSPEIDHITRDNVCYTTEDLNHISVRNVTLPGGTWVNLGDDPMPWEFIFTSNMTSRYKTQWPHSVKAGIDYDIRLETGWNIPLLLVDDIMSGKTHWDISGELGGERGRTTTGTSTTTWGVSGFVHPGKTVTCIASTVTAGGTFTVTSDITVYYKDGTRWTYSSVDTIEGNNMEVPNGVTQCWGHDTIGTDFRMPDAQHVGAAMGPLIDYKDDRSMIVLANTVDDLEREMISSDAV